MGMMIREAGRLAQTERTGRKNNVPKKLLLCAAASPKIMEKEDELALPGYDDTPLRQQQML